MKSRHPDLPPPFLIVRRNAKLLESLAKAAQDESWDGTPEHLLWLWNHFTPVELVATQHELGRLMNSTLNSIFEI